MFLNMTNRKKLALKLRKAFHLSASDWLLILQASSWFAVVEFGLRVVKVKSLLAVLQSDKRDEREYGERVPANAERVAYCVALASRLHPLRPTCLKKALVLNTMVARGAVKVRVIIGAAKSEGKLDAHAWLEHEGRIILGGLGSERYSPLYCLDHSLRLAADGEG